MGKKRTYDEKTRESQKKYRKKNAEKLKQKRHEAYMRKKKEHEMLKNNWTILKNFVLIEHEKAHFKSKYAKIYDKMLELENDTKRI